MAKTSSVHPHSDLLNALAIVRDYHRDGVNNIGVWFGNEFNASGTYDVFDCYSDEEVMTVLRDAHGEFVGFYPNTPVELFGVHVYADSQIDDLIFAN